LREFLGVGGLVRSSFLCQDGGTLKNVWSSRLNRQKPRVFPGKKFDNQSAACLRHPPLNLAEGASISQGIILNLPPIGFASKLWIVFLRSVSLRENLLHCPNGSDFRFGLTAQIEESDGMRHLREEIIWCEKETGLRSGLDFQRARAVLAALGCIPQVASGLLVTAFGLLLLSVPLAVNGCSRPEGSPAGSTEAKVSLGEAPTKGSPADSGQLPAEGKSGGEALDHETPSASAEVPSGGKASEVQPPANAEELKARLRERNPLFQAEVGVELADGKIVSVEIHDENLRDISPLAGLPLEILDLAGCPVEDLYPLKGMPLRVLYLERTRVQDLTPLKGMPLVELRLNETPVEDLRPLAGAPLRRLYLARTKVRDLSPLAGSIYLDSLWLNDCPVEDIRPLATCPNLVSLTLAGTQVQDLSPLKGLRLERLHIARTPVEDLRPLAWLRLTRLVFTPSRIKEGLDVVRRMPTLREIGTAFGEEDRGLESDLRPPHLFWQEFDAGRFQNGP